MTEATGESVVRLVTLLPFPLTDKGGINTFVRNLIEELGAEFEVTPLLIASDRFTARSGRYLAHLEVAIRHVLAMLRLKPDIVHTHEHAALLAAAILYRILSPRPVRVVHTIHIHPAQRRSLWKRLVLGWMLRRCWSVTVVARATADRLDMIATPVPNHIRVIHGAARVHARERADGQVAAFTRSLQIGDGPTICQISPLNLPAKVAGVARLIEATALIRQRMPAVQLVLVGGGDMRAQVEQIARRVGVADNTYFTGYLDDISVALELADVYCQITLQDACPLSLLEAMSFGKPVVASRTGGIPEVVTDGVDGTLVNSDPGEIADRVLGLLADPRGARALGERALVTVQTGFTWQHVAREFAAVYGLQRKARRPGRREPVLAWSGRSGTGDRG